MNTIVSNSPRSWQYFLAIALPAVVMVAALGINSHKLYQIKQQTEIELQGLAQLTPLFELSMTLQKIRGTTQFQRHGESSFNSEIELLKKQLREQVTTLLASPRVAQLGIDNDLRQLELQTRYTLDAAEINTPQEIFLSHSALVNHSMDIIKRTAENSMLAFDNDPEIYFLAKLTIDQISGLTESLGRVRGIGSGLITNIQLSNSQQVIQEIHTLRNHLNTAHQAISRISTSDSADEKRILLLMSQLFKTSDHFLSQSEQLINGKQINIDAKSFFSEGSRAIEQSMLLFNDANNLLKARLERRQSEAQQTIYYAFGSAVMAILVMAFFVMSFYRKNNTAFQELQCSIASLYDSEAKNRAIINGAVDGVLTISERGIIQSANPAAEKMFGYSAPEMIGNNIDMLMPDPYQSNHDSYLTRYLGTGKRKVIGIGREAEAMRKDGTLFPIELSVSEAPHKGERIFTGTVHDISIRKQHETELKQYKEQLEALVIEKTAELGALHDELKQFAYIASHDLITQLPAIKESAEALGLLVESTAIKTPSDKKSDLNNSQIQPPMIEITKQIKSIVQISSKLEWEINTLIKLSSAGLQELRLEPVNMKILASNLKECVTIPEHLSSTTIKIGELPTVTTDRVAVEQIMKCLLENALRQLTEDRPGIIEINTETHNSQFFFYIRDNGKGIPADELAEMFDPFNKKTTSSSSSSCDEIELTHAMYLTRRLGGSLNCQSTIDEGSLFSFTLPVQNSLISTVIQDNKNDPSTHSARKHSIAS